MAVMDSRIILAGQPVNSLGALAAGTQLAAQTNAVRDQNNLRDLYQTQGQGILAGDASSINALAGLDPMAALDVRNVQDQRAERQERLQMARAAGARAAASAAASQSRAERDAQEAEIRRGLGAARTAGSAAEWDAIATQFGADELVGQFDQRDAVISFYEGYTEPSAPSYREFDGNLYTETPTGLDLAMSGQPDTPTYSIMSPEEVAAIPGLDPSRTYQRNANGQITPVGGAPQQTSVYDENGNLIFSQGAPNAGTGAALSPAQIQQDPIGGADTAFGVAGAARNVANIAADTAGLDQPFPETAQASAELARLTDELTQELSAAYDRQPPSWLMTAIRRTIPEPGSLLTGPQRATTQFNAIRGSLERELATQRRALGGAVSPRSYSETSNRIAVIERMIGRVDSALEGINTSAEGLSEQDTELLNRWLD